MNRSVVFSKRNILEMVRDPMIYIFCVGFPIILIIMFAVINSFADGQTPNFEPISLVTGIITFSYSFVMLMVCLLVSKDRTSALLVRLYSSPIRAVDFVVGYAMPSFLIGIAQAIVCVVAGWIVAVITNSTFFNFGQAALLILSSLPTLVTCIFLGIFIGSVMNEKSAPGITSVFIAAAGVLSGAWIPLDTMGGFETFCRVLPFYPTVYIGRAITGASHTMGGTYQFNQIAVWGLVTILIYMVVSIIIAVCAFFKKMTAEK